jgi:hypothetical protein
MIAAAAGQVTPGATGNENVTLSAAQNNGGVLIGLQAAPASGKKRAHSPVPALVAALRGM